jgi:protein-S-isoprenylcysteine O-methyltransferase Ste14
MANSMRPFDWLVGIVGTFLPLAMRPAEDISRLSSIGQPMQLVGLTLAVVAVTFLGRSIGIVAANRGVKTEGLYRWVRHPMYASYMLSYVGYLFSYPTPRNGLIVALTALALNARAVVEERFLAADAAYRDYLGRVRWRFVPFVY